jgi:predicted nucleic acid-binding protein
MKRILVDTSVWSLALRKKNLSEEEQRIVDRLSRVIRNLELVIIGPIRQEILSGISDRRKFDYELAAECCNKCRMNGIQGSHIDFLVCSVAINNEMAVLTLDRDFLLYKQHMKLKLEKV